MADLHEKLAGLRGLYQDLSSLSDSSLEKVERLRNELDAHIDDFRKLLDKPAKNNASRQSIISGKLTVADDEYSINQEFQQGALQLADALNIDEIKAAELFFAAQEDSQILDRSPLISAIMRFHERRQFLLECLRLIFHEYIEEEGDENAVREETRAVRDIAILMEEALAHILGTKAGCPQNSSQFAKKAMTSMSEIEAWISLLGEQAQKASIVGQEDHDIMEAIEYQRQSLQQQHESLGAILFYLFKGTWTVSKDLEILITHLKKLERFDGLLIHYIPVTIASFTRYGSPGRFHNYEDARSLHTIITTTKDGQTWKMQSFHSAAIAFWLAVYSAWYYEDGTSTQTPGASSEEEAKEHTNMFMAALDDGALDFVLAICSSVNSEEWADPARSELVALLLKESVITLPDSESCSSHMKRLLMESFEVFVESCIENMPDAVRRLKSEEDSQRLTQITALREGLTSSLHRGLVEARTHLESLLMVISFAFEHRQEAAQQFWVDPDNNLHGFLQWASKRQTVPRVSAFCEMLCSISEGEANANHAHEFLKEEDKFIGAKLRRSTTMNWTQMFAELRLYATRVTEKPSSSTVQQRILHARKPEHVDMSEPESPVMLTCYLRLMGHLCKQSKAIRDWILQGQTFNAVSTLLTLCSGPIPTHLRATTFATLAALMTDRSIAHGSDMWQQIDQWLSGGAMGAAGIGKMPYGPSSPTPVWHEQQALRKIGESFDQTNAFVLLINSLIEPSTELAESPLSVPFPESLGATYRMPGIEPYIDFIMGHALSRKIQDLNDYQSRLLTYHCLVFVVTGLRTFNEDLVTILNQRSLTSDTAASSSTLTSYIRLHPFARVMEWLFNEDVLRALFATGQQDVSQIAQASSDSVLVLNLLHSVEVMNLILDLQSTYFNVVRPIIKAVHVGNRTHVANSSLASFEDSVLNNLTLVPTLCLYCGTGHQQLTVASMALLEKLTSSRKLNRMSSPELTKWQPSNKIVEVLAAEVDVDSVTRSLSSQMIPDQRELEWGSEAAGYVIRESLLALLNSCLSMITDRPTVAHLLLGFNCVGNLLDVSPEGLFAQRMSLLHAIIEFLECYPDAMYGRIVSWTVHLKRMAFEVLKHLWSSRLAAYFTLGEVRAQGFLANMLAQQPIVGPQTIWNDCLIGSDAFWLTDSSSALAEFLLYRSYLFTYAATEIRSVANLGSPTLQTDILSMLLGNSISDNGQAVHSPSVFDLFDFADLDVSREFDVSKLALLGPVAVDACTRQGKDSLILYNVAEVEELLQVRKAELLANGHTRPQDEIEFQKEANTVKAIVFASNQSRQIRYNRYLALRSWSELITSIVCFSVLDDSSRPTFILHTIQLILPKLEVSIEKDSPEALELARLAETLINKLASDVSANTAGRSADIIDEKLHQLFQASTRGITLASGNVALREVLYSICSSYITRITSSEATHETLRRHSQQVIKTASPGLVEIICDDAYTGQEACRAAALLLLNCLADLDSQVDCALAKSMSQSNYLSLFMDAVRSLPVDLRNAEGADTPALLAYFESLLALLQRLSLTKNGATYVLKSGLFESVRDSQLFATDPDIGIDIDNPDALRKYYDLLLSMLRVVVTAVFSRGIHNEQIKAQTLGFIAETRPCMVGVFKRFAKIGGTTAADHGNTLGELVTSFIALVTATSFLEFEEQETRRTTQPTLFT